MTSTTTTTARAGRRAGAAFHARFASDIRERKPQAAIAYCRISKADGLDPSAPDYDEQVRRGVTRQERELRRWADANGWVIARVVVDNDLSASREGVWRPGWEDDVMPDLEAGRADGLLAIHNDRMTRKPEEWEALIRVADRRGVPLQTTRAGTFDVSTPMGRTIARIVGAVIRGESETMAQRLRETHAALADEGKDSGGGPVFGYGPKLRGRPREIIAVQADAIRDAVRDYLAGKVSLREIARRWTEAAQTEPLMLPPRFGEHSKRAPRPGQRVRATNRAAWNPTTVRRILGSPRIAGMRAVYLRRDDGTIDTKGEIVGKAEWDAIISEADMIELRRRIFGSDPARRGSPDDHLLVGLAVCASCGSVLYSGGPDRLRCSGREHRCGLTIRRHDTEQLVTAEFMRVADSGKLRAFMSKADTEAADDRAALVVVQDEKVQLSRDKGAGIIDRDEWLAQREGLLARERTLRARIEARTEWRELDELLDTPGPVAARWETMTTAQQRRILARFIEVVRVKPGLRGRTRFDPDRVETIWRR